jgi:hypothetical protein
VRDQDFLLALSGDNVSCLATLAPQRKENFAGTLEKAQSGETNV